MFDLPGARLTLHEADGFDGRGRLGRFLLDGLPRHLGMAASSSGGSGACARRGPKTIMTGERLCQMLDPFGNLFGLRQPPA